MKLLSIGMVLGVSHAVSLSKWTNMDSSIRDAEAALFTGGEPLDNYKTTTLTGYNDQYDPLVTHMHDPGDPAMDDSFLRKVFHNHFTIHHTDGEKKSDPGVDQRVLTRDNAWLASRDVVQAWNHLD